MICSLTCATRLAKPLANALLVTATNAPPSAVRLPGDQAGFSEESHNRRFRTKRTVKL
jgi:hypothetical protein